jgi:hypothetical protein
MSVSTEPTARKRRSRTRTKKISPREALVLSTLRPHQFDLRPACASLICPDCKTWCPITGVQAKVQKLVPHHTSPADEGRAIRCSGSNRRVIVDVAYEAWWKRLEDGAAQTDGRRSTRVLRKPKAPSGAAVHHIAQGRTPAPEPTAAERAEQWAEALLPVFVADTQRRIAPLNTPGPVQGPIRGAEVPTETLRPAV